MFATRTVRFALVAAVLSSLTDAAPLFNFGRKEAVAMVRRAENDGQLAQGTNYFFSTLHLEDACSPGQVACVSGNYATCSGEGNWEITPCASGSTCLATPASSPSGISVQCTSQESAQSSIQNAGGNPNTIAADFHVTDAPFSAQTVPDPSASSSASATPTSPESSSAPADTASPTDAPSETASATESSASSTCTPDDGDDDGDDDGTIADGPTSTATESTPTETPSPTGTCTDEEPVETETITVIVVPVPSSTGVYSTTTLFPEEPEPTVVGTDVPIPTESSSSSEAVPTESSSSTDSAPTESSASSEAAPTESSTESAPTESSSSSEAPAATESSSSSESAATVTTIVIEPGYSIPALPTGAGGASTPVAIPVVSVVGTHTVPSKRMVRVLRRV